MSFVYIGPVSSNQVSSSEYFQSEIGLEATTPTEIVVTPSIWETDVKEGENAVQIVTVNNTGDTAITITAINSNAEWLSVIDRNYTQVLSSGESMNFPVLIVPPEDLDVANTYNGQIAIVTDVTTKFFSISFDYIDWSPQLINDNPVIYEFPPINISKPFELPLISNQSEVSITNIVVNNDLIEVIDYSDTFGLLHPGSAKFVINSVDLEEKWYQSDIEIVSDEGTRTIPVLFSPFDTKQVQGINQTSYTIDDLPFASGSKFIDENNTIHYFFPVDSFTQRLRINVEKNTSDVVLIDPLDQTIIPADITPELLSEGLVFDLDDPTPGIYHLYLNYIDTSIDQYEIGEYIVRITETGLSYLNEFPIKEKLVVQTLESKEFRFPVISGLDHLAVDISFISSDGIKLISPSGQLFVAEETTTDIQYDVINPESGIWTLTVAPTDQIGQDEILTLDIYGHSPTFLDRFPLKLDGNIPFGDQIRYKIFVPDSYPNISISSDNEFSQENIRLIDPNNNLIEAQGEEYLYDLEFPIGGFYTLEISGQGISSDYESYSISIFSVADYLKDITIDTSTLYVENIDRGTKIEESVFINNNSNQTLSINQISVDLPWVEAGNPVNSSIISGASTVFPFIVSPSYVVAGYYEAQILISTNFGPIYARASINVQDTFVSMEFDEFRTNVPSTPTIQPHTNTITNIGNGNLAIYKLESSQIWIQNLQIDDLDILPGETGMISYDINLTAMLSTRPNNSVSTGLYSAPVIIRSNQGPIIMQTYFIVDQLEHNSSLESFDFNGPSIANLARLDVFPEQANDVTISADVTDDDLYKSWVVFDQGSDWDQYEFTDQVSIGQFLKGTPLRYYVVAIDKVGNIAKSNQGFVIVDNYLINGYTTDNQDTSLAGASIIVENGDSGEVINAITDRFGYYEVYLKDFSNGDTINVVSTYGSLVGDGSTTVDTNNFVSSVDIELIGDDTAPTITSFGDISYEFEDNFVEIEWEITDTNPSHYILWQNGTIIQAGAWVSGLIIITFSTQVLANQSFEFYIEVYDFAGNKANSTIYVSYITPVPDDISSTTTDDDEGPTTSPEEDSPFYFGLSIVLLPLMYRRRRRRMNI